MFLKYNRRLWDLSDIVEANKRHKGERGRTTDRVNILKEIEAKLADVEEWEGQLGCC